MCLFLGLDVLAADSVSATAQTFFKAMDSGSSKILSLMGKNNNNHGAMGHALVSIVFVALMIVLAWIVCRKIFFESGNSTTIPQIEEQRHEEQPQESTTTATKRECF